MAHVFSRFFAHSRFILAGILILALFLGGDLAGASPQAIFSTSMDVGNSAVCAIVGGMLRCWGRGLVTGTGVAIDRPVPAVVNGLSNGVSQVSVGSAHACALVNGAVKCWGRGIQGQLGNNTLADSSVPVQTTGLSSGVIAIGTGYDHSCAVLSGGGVKCWGLDSNGEIGDGSPGGWNETPSPVVGLSGPVTKVVGGGAHTCALLQSGGLQCWGYNYYGSLGIGNTEDQSTAQNVVGLSSGVVDVEAGYLHTCALMSTGEVKCWGSWGDALISSTPQTVAAFGNNNKALALGAGTVCALDTAGVVRCAGFAGRSNTPEVVTHLSGPATAISAGIYTYCALVNNVPECWGSDLFSQLGIGSATYARTAWAIPELIQPGVLKFAAGHLHTCAINGSGGLECWGGNYDGELGIGPNTSGTSYNLPQTVLNVSSGATDVSAGMQYTCAVINGAAKCWGSNDYGQLGDGSTTNRDTPTQVSGLASGVSAIAAAKGFEHTCAIVSGAVKCWGRNNTGQVGNGTKDLINPVTTPVQVVGLTSGATAISVGGSVAFSGGHSCAIVNGGAKCWGFQYYGQLGNGVSTTYTPATSPVNVIGLGNGVTAIGAGDDFTCAIHNGGVKCWGRNHRGQLGTGGLADSATPVDIYTYDLQSGVSALAVGRQTACAVKNGAVYCWGYGVGVEGSDSSFPVLVGQLTSGVTQAAIAWNTLYAIKDNIPYAWGSDQEGLLGMGRPSRRDESHPVVGFGPTPELFLMYPTAAPGSLLRFVGANFPPFTTLPIRLNDKVLGEVYSDSTGFFSLVLGTTGEAPGFYEIEVNSKGTPVRAAFTLDAAAPLLSAEGGGVFLGMAAAAPPDPTPVPSPTPRPTNTPVPGSIPPSPTPQPGLVVAAVMPSVGDAGQPMRVEIYGSNFQPGAVARLGGVPALSTVYDHPGHLVVTWPGMIAAYTYDVTVTNPNWETFTLPAAYTAQYAFGSGGNPIQEDLFSYAYELVPNPQSLVPGQVVSLNLVVHRLGGTGSLFNIPVNFYYGSPALTNPQDGTFIGQAQVGALFANMQANASLNWTAPAEGTYKIFAVIDPDNLFLENKEDNNTYTNYAYVNPPPPPVNPDTQPPVVDTVTSPLISYSSQVTLDITAHDVGPSGIAWVDIIVWEYFPTAQAWLVTDETGWRPFSGTGSFSYNMGYFEGPRFFDVYVADNADNISVQPRSSITNYIKPNHFVGEGSSHLFAFPFEAGDFFSCSLVNSYSDSDADLYFWPPDYPGRPYWVSAHAGSTPEVLNVSIPVAGWYWLEVYGYTFSFYDLQVFLSRQAGRAETASFTDKPFRSYPLAGPSTLPSHLTNLAPLPTRIYLPLVRR